MSIATRPPRHRLLPLPLLALVAAVSLGTAACGTDETIEAGSNTTDGFTPMTPRTDLIQLVVSEPEIMADPTDDSRLLIHFEGASEPCAGAAVSVLEDDTSVAIVFQTGLDPNIAAMSCIAGVFDYEIVVQLDAPLGDRTIGVAN